MNRMFRGGSKFPNFQRPVLVCIDAYFSDSTFFSFYTHKSRRVHNFLFGDRQSIEDAPFDLAHSVSLSIRALTYGWGISIRSLSVPIGLGLVGYNRRVFRKCSSHACMPGEALIRDNTIQSKVGHGNAEVINGDVFIRNSLTSGLATRKSYMATFSYEVV